MSAGIGDFVSDDTEDEEELLLKTTAVEYDDTDSGTVIHLFGRDEDRDRHHVEVVGHNPSFFIRDDEYSERIDNHYAVSHTEHFDSDGDRYTTLYDEPLVRVYTHQSSAVGEMRDLFDETWEADVLYDKRFLIDNEITVGTQIDTSDAVTEEPWLKGDIRVENEAITSADLDEYPTPQPRKMVFDIEVASEGGFPDSDKAEWPVSTIVAWDSYTQEYVGWLLRHESHMEGEDLVISDSIERKEDADLDDLRVFEDESSMLDDFHHHVGEVDPDIITGWNSNGFDIPYLFNRSRDLNTYSYRDWSPLGEAWDGKYEPVVKGRECVDMMEAYEKTQIHELDSKALDDVAADELGTEKVGASVVGGSDQSDPDEERVGKLDVEESHTQMWKDDPIEFLRYNKVDVELVHRIDEESGATAMLDHLRNIAGVDYTDLPGGAIEMIDMVFLRKAAEYGYRLPTAVKPEVGDFRGAWVYTPEPGLHEHVAYPDYSSLYPNEQYQCNISPETLIGTKEDLEASEYTEEDCVWSYIDTETPPEQKEDVPIEDHMLEKVYFLKPSIKEGFVRAVLDDIMGLADRYTGGMYEAAKRVRNASWGVMGDSDSYGDGFRLFDWRLAEATTLGGQKVLKGGAEKFVEEVNDVGDSSSHESDNGRDSVVEHPDAYIAGGDTDSYMTSMPNADSGEHALELAFDAAESTNEWLDGFAVETFGLEDESEARMELEVESYAGKLFFKGDDDHDYEKGVKKRYAQRMEWDDDDLWYDEPETKIKGFEYVRSDVADITKELQYETFEIMLDDDPNTEERVKEVTREKIDTLFSGEHNDAIGKPFGIGQPVSQYGAVDHTPQPQYRGVKFANEFVYEGDAISEGDKPTYWYIEEGKTGPELRNTYSASTREDGRYVDAISAFEWDDLPEGVRIDYPKMAQKTTIDPMADIWHTMGWGVEWATRYVEDATPPEYHREESQLGVDEFM